jgi:DNA processing protein
MEKYCPPITVEQVSLMEVLDGTPRAASAFRSSPLLNDSQTDFLNSVTLNIAGNKDLLKRPCISIIGARKATDLGRLRARRLARELVSHGIVILSGLADGIDTAAMNSAISAGGSTAGVIGTPLDIAYPASNKRLQEIVYRDHVLVSQFQKGERVSSSNFPMRNRLMALMSDATVVIEASDTSGTLHQAKECLALGRWLFIARSAFENKSINWPARFIESEQCRILDSTEEIISTVYGRI